MSRREEWEYLGGRSIEDIEQYCLSIYSKVRENFSMNEVPPEIAGRVEVILCEAKMLTTKINYLIDLMIKAGSPQPTERGDAE